MEVEKDFPGWENMSGLKAFLADKYSFRDGDPDPGYQFNKIML